jgi:hypothetical protein
LCARLTTLVLAPNTHTHTHTHRLAFGIEPQATGEEEGVTVNFSDLGVWGYGMGAYVVPVWGPGCSGQRSGGLVYAVIRPEPMAAMARSMLSSPLAAGGDDEDYHAVRCGGGGGRFSLEDELASPGSSFDPTLDPQVIPLSTPQYPIYRLTHWFHCL